MQGEDPEQQDAESPRLVEIFCITIMAVTWLCVCVWWGSMSNYTPIKQIKICEFGSATALHAIPALGRQRPTVHCERLSVPTLSTPFFLSPYIFLPVYVLHVLSNTLKLGEFWARAMA